MTAGHIVSRAEDFNSCLLPARKHVEALGVRLPPARLSNVPHRLGDEIVCHRKSNLIGAGPVVSLAFKSTIDVPARFKNSKAVGPSLGSTPVLNQSGESHRPRLLVRGRNHAGASL